MKILKNMTLYYNKIVRILIIILLLILFFSFSNKYKEGVIFTRYDNKKYFTKPWNNFCIPTAPELSTGFFRKTGMIGEYPIGCNCKDIGVSKVPPAIPDSCYNEEYQLYFNK